MTLLYHKIVNHPSGTKSYLKQTAYDTIIYMERLSNYDHIDDADEILDSDFEASDVTTWGNIAEKAGPFRPEILINDKEAKERQLRNELFETHEAGIDKERRALDKVSSELKMAGFNSFSRRIDDYREGTTRVDKRLCETMVNYMDAKFTDPKIADKIWSEYSHDTRKRALILENTLGSVQRGLIISGEGFDKVAEKVSDFKSTIPAAQVGLLKYYKAYFDEPSERNRNVLISQVCGDIKNGERAGGYTSAVSEGLRDIAESLDQTTYGIDDITYSVEVDLGRAVDETRKNGVLSVIKYYEYKIKNHDGAMPKKPELIRASKLLDEII